MNLTYIASLSVSVEGITSMFPTVQLSAVVYNKYKATVPGFANGVKGASASVLLIFKLLYDSNAALSFQWCLTTYCWIVAFLSILTTFMFTPSKNEFDLFLAESHAVLSTAKGKDRSNSGINPISTGGGACFPSRVLLFACNLFVVLESISPKFGTFS